MMSMQNQKFVLHTLWPPFGGVRMLVAVVWWFDPDSTPLLLVSAYLRDKFQTPRPDISGPFQSDPSFLSIVYPVLQACLTFQCSADHARALSSSSSCSLKVLQGQFTWK